MISWRSIGFWPGTFLGALLGLVLAHGFLSTPTSGSVVPGPRKESIAQDTELGTDMEDGIVEPPFVDTDAGYAEICNYSPTEEAEALTDLVSDTPSGDDAERSDSTFEQLLTNHVLSTYSSSMGSRCSPVVKYEATGRVVLTTDVNEEGFGRAVNVVPTSTGKVFSRGRVRLDDLYRSVLDLARMAPGTVDMGFTRTKASALRELAKSERASDFGPEKYYAAAPMPREWFTNDAYWSTFSMDYTNKRQARSDTSRISTSIGQLTFEYCIVGIDRPWFSDALFRSHKRWCMPHTAIGEFSEQHDLKLLPVAMVIVRDLALKLDPAHAAQPFPSSIFLEPLTRTDGKWTSINGQLVNPSKQIVAWICLPLPPIPPTTAPGSVNTLKDPIGQTRARRSIDPFAPMRAERTLYTNPPSIT